MNEELKERINEWIESCIIENGSCSYDDVLWSLVNVDGYMLDVDEDEFKTYINEKIAELSLSIN